MHSSGAAIILALCGLLVQVKRSLGYGLDENAIEAVRNWQFKPVVGLEDKPVPVWTDIEVNFRIK